MSACNLFSQIHITIKPPSLVNAFLILLISMIKMTNFTEDETIKNVYLHICRYIIWHNMYGCIFLSFSLAVLYVCVLVPSLMSISVMG